METPNIFNLEEISSIIFGFSQCIFETLLNLREAGNETKSLIGACYSDKISAVRKLITEGYSLNETSPVGENFLTLACLTNCFELAQVLLAMHANVEEKSAKDGCTPLMEAASAGSVKLVKLLLEYGADVNSLSFCENSPLMFASAGGHVDSVIELLNYGANINHRNKHGHTSLMEATSAGHITVAKILIEHGASIYTHSDQYSQSALSLACFKGHLEMVRFLLVAESYHENKTEYFHTALFSATLKGHVEIAKLLLDSGAQVNKIDTDFESPLSLAAKNGFIELALLFIERGANIEESNILGYTPLMIAVQAGLKDMVSALLSEGANINAFNEKTRETPLTLACQYGFMNLADILIKSGADLELGTPTPLMEASKSNYPYLVRRLLECGSNVNAQTSTGFTALTYARTMNNIKVVDTLLEFGAKIHKKIRKRGSTLRKARNEAGSKGTKNNVKIVPNIQCQSEENVPQATGSVLKHSVNKSLSQHLPMEIHSGGFFCKYNKESIIAAIMRMEIAEVIKNKKSGEACYDVVKRNNVDKNLVRLILSTEYQPLDTFENQLSLACSVGCYDLAQVLLAIKTNVEGKSAKDGCTPLMEAASAGTTELVKLLLEYGANVNSLSFSGNSPLMYACAGGHVDTVVELLNNGANVEVHNKSGHTPLMEAASAGHVTIAKMLLKRGASIYTHLAQCIQSPLSLACYKGHLGMVQFLLMAGSNYEHKVDDMYTALIVASTKGLVKIAKLLLDNGAQVSMPIKGVESPLKLAVLSSHLELAFLLVDRGANIEEATDDNGYNLILENFLKIFKKFEQKTSVSLNVLQIKSDGTVIKQNIEKVVDIHRHPSILQMPISSTSGFVDTKKHVMSMETSTDSTRPSSSVPYIFGETLTGLTANEEIAFIKACVDGDFSHVHKLLTERHSIHETSIDSKSLLSLACSAGDFNLAQALLATQVDIEEQNNEDGCTPLMKAAFAGSVELVELLIAHGCMVNASSLTGDTPLIYACAGGHVETITDLLRREANVEDHNIIGHTPLMVAARAGHVMAAKILLEHGACIYTHSNQFKQSALTLACDNGHLEMVRFLLVAESDHEYKINNMCRALAKASKKGHIEVARLLLDSGAQVNMPIEGVEPPLQLAMRGGHIDLAFLLIDRGANVGDVIVDGHDSVKVSPPKDLDYVETDFVRHDLSEVDILLKSSNPLIYAAKYGFLQIVRFHLDRGEDVNAQTSTTADTALTIACEYGHTEIAELLIQAGANMHHNSESGTPFSLACRGNHTKIIQLLISKFDELNL